MAIIFWLWHNIKKAAMEKTGEWVIAWLLVGCLSFGLILVFFPYSDIGRATCLLSFFFFLNIGLLPLYIRACQTICTVIPHIFQSAKQDYQKFLLEDYQTYKKKKHEEES